MSILNYYQELSSSNKDASYICEKIWIEGINPQLVELLFNHWKYKSEKKLLPPEEGLKKILRELLSTENYSI